MRRASRIDKNQPELVEHMRSLGAYVVHCHDLKNFADLFVVYRGQTMAMEIKDPVAASLPKYFWELSHEKQIEYVVGNHLTPGEKECREEVLARNGNYKIVWSKESVLILAGW